MKSLGVNLKKQVKNTALLVINHFFREHCNK